MEPLLKALPSPFQSAIGYSAGVASVDASPSVIGLDDAVATKDVPLNQSSGTFVRIYLPPSSSASVKLPTLIYFHGGAFVFGSTTDENYNDYLSKLAAAANTLIVSVEYRLAPAHRLPTSYDDCFEALIWLHEQAKLQSEALVGEEGTIVEVEPWVAAHADFSKCFLGGDSAGGNITHHVAMRAGQSQALEYLRVQGMILLHPSFWASIPSNDKWVLWSLRNIIWLLTLPVGTTSPADHPFSNPLSPAAPSLADASLPRALVAVATEDMLLSAGENYFAALETAGKDAKLFTSEGEGHCFFLDAPAESENARELLEELIRFLNN